MRRALLVCLFLTLVTLVGCGAGDASSVDSSDNASNDDLSKKKVDAGKPAPGPDAGHAGLDAGHAGLDAGQPGLDAGQPGLDAGSTGTACIRAVNGNLSSGSKQSYDPGEGLRIFKGLNPDVIMIQEFNYGDDTDATIQGIVTSTFGAGFSVFHETGTGIQIPNGIISRYPIISSGSWKDSSVANRGFAWAEIAIPGPTHLWAVSLHLLTTGSSERASEATQIINYVKQNVPAGDYLVVGGDLNTGSRTEQCITTFSQVVVTTGPFPTDQSGNANTSGYNGACGVSGRSKPHDWVMPNAALHAHEVAVKIGSSSFPYGLVFDSCLYSPLSDVPPILKTDSGGDSMQHMAVVRDFCPPQ